MNTRVFARAVLASSMSLTACSGPAPADVPMLDGGAPRQLIYVTAARPVLKHGGAHSKKVDTVYFFDRSTFEVVDGVTLEGGVGDVGATGDGRTVYVVNPGGNSVTLLDTNTFKLTSLDVGAGPEHSYLTPDHAQLWVANDTSANVTVIDLASRQVLGSALTGFGHHKIAFAEDDEGRVSFGYVSNIGDSSITPVTAERLTLTNVPGVGVSPHGIDYSRSTHRIFNCSGDQQKSIEVIATRDDASTPEVNEQHTIVARVPLPSRCRSLHAADDGAYAYASLTDVDMFVRIDAATLDVSMYETGDAPDGFVVVGDLAYVGNTRAPTLSVIDLTRTSPTFTISVGDAVDATDEEAEGGRLVRRDGPHLFVTNAFDGTVSVVDLATNIVVGTLRGVPDVVGVAVAGPSGGTAFPR